MDYLGVLKELSTYPGVSGSEERLAAHIKNLFDKHCNSVEIDRFSNVIGLKKGDEGRKKIMVTAHLDEIGLMVSSIDDRGFIKFGNVGGVDPKILLAQEVVIHGRKDVVGIVGAKPPHLLKQDEVRKAVKLEDLAIDTGMPGNKVKELVSIGDIITLKASPVSLLGSKISGKSMDNRCGVAVLIEAVEELARMKHDCDVYFVATTQEEVAGSVGAVSASFNIRPDIAIVIDACHGDMPDAPREETYPLGKGPAVAIGPNLHKKLTRKLIDTAKDESIPHQIDVEPGNTGTEAWAIQVSRSGIPTVLISIPLRYMHTTVETVNTNDMKNAARLTARFITRVEKELEVILCS